MSVFPEPSQYSPSFQFVWNELHTIFENKLQILHTVPIEEREGEWQILSDNPHTHREILCIPELNFLEAAYYYGYYRVDLKRNEYIRLQKVHNVHMEFGS